MKTSFFSAFAAIALLASTSAFAAPAPAANHDRDDRRPAQGPGNRYDDRNSKDFNYGYDRKHRVTPQERARWEAAHRNDRRDDHRDDHRGPAVAVVAPSQQARWEAERRNNYGYAKNHRVTDQERARWDAAHRYDHR
ncbi:hypothetical protein [Hymenobacter nivis]|uniref:Uncharacterized protein n=1 Tax=Hymenobacter nivis TaxID=1850093 RepID=A0A502HEV8_9BACT|nr:hypothetical protein [Hymenobacter nivis]TPG72202.1 hypothetical protein EAH73_02910 [Hymenobacter nivis]